MEENTGAVSNLGLLLLRLRHLFVHGAKMRLSDGAGAEPTRYTQLCFCTGAGVHTLWLVKPWATIDSVQPPESVEIKI